MSYTYTFDIHLGPIYAGLTLAAQLIDTAGVSVGSEITSGFVEAGSNGDYLWTATIPDGHRGGVLVYEDGAPGVVLAVGAINPEDAEYVASILQDTGTTLPGLIAAGTGSGAVSFPVTINDEASNPIDGVEVWVSTDSAGTNVVAGTLSTDASGIVTFMLDAGSYYVWRQKSGYNFTNPVAITVT